MSACDESSCLIFLTACNDCRHLRLITRFIQLHETAEKKIISTFLWKNKHKNMILLPRKHVVHTEEKVGICLVV